ncbi:MAG: hypothetical protein ACI81R_001842 [Bradymonadia bacterium]|jgi:hypothetical protein
MRLPLLSSCCVALLVACATGSDAPAADVGQRDSSITPDGESVGDQDADAVSDVQDGESDTDEDVEDDTADVSDGSGDTDVEEWPFDCPRPECVADEDCQTEGAACIGGVCADAVDPAAWVAGPLVGYVSGVTLGTAGEPCCFDLDGDDSVDNMAATLLETYASQSNAPPLQQQLEDMIAFASTTVVASYTPLDETAGRMAIVFADNDLDSDGNADTSAEDREAGLGEFLVDSRTLGANGPEVQWYASTLEGGDRCSAPTDFTVELPLNQACPFRWDTEEPAADGTRCRGEEEGAFTVFDMRAEGALQLGDDSLSTAEGQSLRVGGYLHMDAFATIMNVSYGDSCACVTGLGRDGDLIESFVEDDEFGFRCTIDVGDEELADCGEFQRQCAGIPNFCGALPLLGALAEHDGDGDGVNDSVSFGMSLTFAPGTIIDGRASANELCADGQDNDGDTLVDCDDPECWDDTNCGSDGWGEQCNNGRDDNDNDLVDCGDSQCADNIACVAADGRGE